MLNPFKIFMSALFAAAVTANLGQADLVLQFVPEETDIQVGESVQVTILMTQIFDTTPVDLSAVGLTNADIQLTLDSTAVAVTAFSFGGGFEDTSFSDLSDMSMPLLSAQSTSLSGVRADAGGSSIDIGSFTLTGTGVGTTIISTLDTSFQDFVFEGFTDDFDSHIFGGESVTLRVSAVPEPSSLILVSVACMSMGIARRRRLEATK